MATTIVTVAVVTSSCSDTEPTTTTTTAITAPTTVTTVAPTTTTAATTTSVAATEPPPTTTTSTLAVPIEAAIPPPASFAEVQADYEATVDALLAEGRVVTDAFLADDAEALQAMFDATMAAQFSADELRATRSQLEAQAPLGGRGAERAMQLDPATGFYTAEVAWGEDVLALSVAFNEADEVSSLLLTPQPSLEDDPAAAHESTVDYRLPFDGLWLIVWGGDTPLDNYHVAVPDQRHALDIVVWKDGGTNAGDGTVNEDYWVYGQRVLAPADGTVVTVVDGLPDQAPRTESDTANPAGNHVVIQVADGEYVLLAHMQPGSIVVTEGDVVASGEQIGLVGNSGNTSEPHLHVHAQDRPTFDPGATGLPLEFTDYVANGQSVSSGRPAADQFVAVE